MTWKYYWWNFVSLHYNFIRQKNYEKFIKRDFENHVLYVMDDGWRTRKQALKLISFYKERMYPTFWCEFNPKRHGSVGFKNYHPFSGAVGGTYC